MKLLDTAVGLAVVLAIGYVGFCAGMYLLQERFLFFPEKLPAVYQFDFATPFEELHLPVAEASLHALHFRADQPGAPKGVVLYWHGNAGSLRSWGDVATEFVEQGYDVVMPDYRGYGKSSGEITDEATLMTDAEVVYTHVLSQYEPEEIILYGRSIGSGPAIHLATVRSPRLLILEAPFYSIRELVRRQMPILPPFLVKYPLRNDVRIGEVTCPVVIFHGTQDEVIPFEHGRRLAQAVPSSHRFVAVEGGHHNDLADSALYWQELQQALQ